MHALEVILNFLKAEQLLGGDKKRSSVKKTTLVQLLHLPQMKTRKTWHFHEKLRVLLPLSCTETLHDSSLWPQNSDLLENTYFFFTSGLQNKSKLQVIMYHCKTSPLTFSSLAWDRERIPVKIFFLVKCRLLFKLTRFMSWQAIQPVENWNKLIVCFVRVS